jgi:hypothetical protein
MADPLTEFILLNHKIFIICCFILVIYYVGLLIIFLLKSSGLIFNRQFHDLNNEILKNIHNIKSNNYVSNLTRKLYYKANKKYFQNDKTIIEIDNLNKKDYLYFVVMIIAFIMPIIAFIAEQIVRIQLCALLWIFIFWIIIKTIVPLIIPFTIPIFPFIFILPLRMMMLEFIPPFKVLTDLGTLPLLYRLITRIFNPNVFDDYINNFIKPNIKDISDYLFYHVRNLGKKYAKDLYDNNSKEGEERRRKDDENIANMSGENEEEGRRKYQEYKETDSVKTTMNKIDEDTQICIGLNQQFNPYGASYASEVSADIKNSFNPYSKCYTAAIKSYIKTSIAPPP